MDGLDDLSKSLLALLSYISVSYWEKVIAASLFVVIITEKNFASLLHMFLVNKKQNWKEQITLGGMQEWNLLTKSTLFQVNISSTHMTLYDTQLCHSTLEGKLGAFSWRLYKKLSVWNYCLYALAVLPVICAFIICDYVNIMNGRTASQGFCFSVWFSAIHPSAIHLSNICWFNTICQTLLLSWGIQG